MFKPEQNYINVGYGSVDRCVRQTKLCGINSMVLQTDRVHPTPASSCSFVFNTSPIIYSEYVLLGRENVNARKTHKTYSASNSIFLC